MKHTTPLEKSMLATYILSVVLLFASSLAKDAVPFCLLVGGSMMLGLVAITILLILSRRDRY